MLGVRAVKYVFPCSKTGLTEPFSPLSDRDLRTVDLCC